MESDKVELHYSYSMQGHHTVWGADADFYLALPNAQEAYINPSTERHEIPRPDVEQILTVIGSAILSSSVLASFIKAYLANTRTKIRISVMPGKVEVEYEGPNLKDSEQAIKDSIDHLVASRNTRELSISAIRTPEEGGSNDAI